MRWFFCAQPACVRSSQHVHADEKHCTSWGALALVGTPLTLPLTEWSEPTFAGERFLLCLPGAVPQTQEPGPQVAAAASCGAATAGDGLAASFFADEASFAAQDFLRGPDASLRLPSGRLVSIPGH
jgi:hypothetical protein